MSTRDEITPYTNLLVIDKKLFLLSMLPTYQLLLFELGGLFRLTERLVEECTYVFLIRLVRERYLYSAEMKKAWVIVLAAASCFCY